jgi:hypothetical protein
MPTFQIWNIEVDGKQVNRQVALPVKFCVTLDGKDAQAFGVNGKPLAPADVVRRLAKPAPSVVFYGEVPDPYYLSVLRAETIVFVLPKDPLNSAPAQPKAAPALTDNLVLGRIVYWEIEPRVTNPLSCETKLMSIGPTDQKPRRLTVNHPLDRTRFDWPLMLSPDGKWAALPGEGVLHIHSLAKPEAKVRILDAKGYPQCWSPDGKQLILTEAFHADGLRQTCVDVDTGTKSAVKVPTLEGAADKDASYVHFVSDWSRDGKWWLVIRWSLKGERRKEPHLYLTKSDGSDPQHLKHIPAACEARFSPDGKQILYLVADSETSSQLFVADVKPSTPVRVSRPANNGIIGHCDFCWSPDGKHVAYVRGSQRRDAQAETHLTVVDADGKNERTLVSVKGEEHELGSPNWR